jgi:hypothetical protein
MGNVTSIKSKFFEPQGVDDNAVSTTGTATTLVIADGGPYGNLTQTITIASASGNNAGNTFTITGTDGNGDALTEDLTGPASGATVNSAEKYLTVTSIVSDGAIVSDIYAGILGTGTGTGTVFAGRTRVRGMQGATKAAAGNVVFKNTSITGTTLFTVPTTGAVSSIEPYIPDNAILFKAGAYVNIPAAAITGLTVFYDG